MGGLFQPDPVILAFIPIKQGVYLLLLLPLVLLRGAFSAGPARRAALAALALALSGLAARYLPEYLGVYEGALFRAAGAWRSLWGGMAMNLAPSLVLWLSGFLPGRRWFALDLVHLVLLIGLMCLWSYSIWG